MIWYDHFHFTLIIINEKKKSLCFLVCPKSWDLKTDYIFWGAKKQPLHYCRLIHPIWLETLQLILRGNWVITPRKIYILNLKIAQLKRKIIFQTSIFAVQNLKESKFLRSNRPHERTLAMGLTFGQLGRGHTSIQCLDACRPIFALGISECHSSSLWEKALQVIKITVNFLEIHFSWKRNCKFICPIHPNIFRIFNGLFSGWGNPPPWNCDLLWGKRDLFHFWIYLIYILIIYIYLYIYKNDMWHVHLWLGHLPRCKIYLQLRKIYFTEGVSHDSSLHFLLYLGSI